jgi:hypothetical protein
MNATGYIAILVYLAPAAPLPAAEMYQWIDSRGVIHFTDTLKNVPAAVRNSAGTHRAAKLFNR